MPEIGLNIGVGWTLVITLISYHKNSLSWKMFVLDDKEIYFDWAVMFSKYWCLKSEKI